MTTELLMLELQDRGMDIKDKLIEHHTKYKEIDGIDETIWITPKEHSAIHREWRRQGKIIKMNICQAAAGRTLRARLKNRRTAIKSHKENAERIHTSYYLGYGAMLSEYWCYNKRLGTINYWAYIISNTPKYKIPVIDI